MSYKYLREKAFPIENSSEILKYLFDKGYEIYIITNGPKRAVKDKAKGTGGLEYIILLHPYQLTFFQ